MLLPEAPKGAAYKVIITDDTLETLIEYEASFTSHQEAEEAFTRVYGSPVKGEWGDPWVAYDSDTGLLAVIPAS